MAKDPHFENIVKKLKAIHKEFPDLKFGHVVQGSVDEFQRNNNVDLHDLSSKLFLTSLESFHRNTKIRRK